MTATGASDPLDAALAAPVALVVSVAPGETRVARLEHGRCVAITSHRPWAANPGAVLLGRMGPRLPAGGAFVDLGPWGDGFLDSRDLTGTVPPKGTAVLTQVRQATRSDPWAGDKAARLTLAPALTTARLALGGRRPGAAISRRVTDEAERRDLLARITDLVAPGESLIGRAAAVGASRHTLLHDLNRLRAHWRHLRDQERNAKPPALVWPAPLAWEEVVFPPAPPPTVVVLDDPTARADLETELADLLGTARTPTILVHRDPTDLWDALGLGEAEEAALAPVVPLPSGGRMVIEPTAALVAIDVDAGAGTAARANAEALERLPHEIRLRGLAGHILVDLIPAGRGPRLTAGARTRLEQALATDPATPRLAGLSRLGLLELTRERRAPTLAEARQGPAAQALAALRMALRDARATAATRLTATVSAPAAALLEGPLAPVLADLRDRHGLTLTVRGGTTDVDAPPDIGPG